MVNLIPNIITCLNLVCGCIAIIFIFMGNMDMVAVCIACSLVFDFFDGFAARRMKVNSNLGKELDSLADMVSFGLVPGLIGCKLCLSSPPFSLNPTEISSIIFGHFPLIITVASAVRLARFNLDTRQTDSFIGVPTPAITILMIGLALVVEHDHLNLTPTILNPFFVCGTSLIVAWLLNSELPMIALKFKSFDWKTNAAQYQLIFYSMVLLVTLRYAGIAAIIILYIVSSFLHFKTSKTEIKT
ncbi:MAG: CDP-alcohol phosphatidyltransferase family protein [Bacteroidota bacterium]